MTPKSARPLLGRISRVANSKDLDVLLADLKRQRIDVEKGLASVGGRTEAAADIVTKLQQLRERAERTNNDHTLRQRPSERA